MGTRLLCICIDTSLYHFMNCHVTDLKEVRKCCGHRFTYVRMSNNAGQPNIVYPSERCTLEGSGIVDTAAMLPGPDVQPLSETSFCTSPLPADTRAPTEHLITAREDEVSHKLDHESADSPRLGKDDSALSRQHPTANKIRDHCRLSPEGPSDTSAPQLFSCTEDAETLGTGQQGENL